MHIECDACAIRGPGCHDCVVTVLVGLPPAATWDDTENLWPVGAARLLADERAALGALIEAGLAPEVLEIGHNSNQTSCVPIDLTPQGRSSTAS